MSWKFMSNWKPEIESMKQKCVYSLRERYDILHMNAGRVLGSDRESLLIQPSAEGVLKDIAPSIVSYRNFLR